MRGADDAADADSVITLVKQTADGLGRLVAEHLKLARLELVYDARDLGRRIGLMALFAPFLLIGYALACVAGAILLSRVVGMAGGFLIVAGANLLIGGIGFYRASSRLKQASVLEHSREELARSAEALKPAEQAATLSKEAHARI